MGYYKICDILQKAGRRAKKEQNLHLGGGGGGAVFFEGNFYR